MRADLRLGALSFALSLMSSACVAPQPADVSRVISASPFPSASEPSPLPSPTVSPKKDVRGYVRPLVSSWRPKGTSVLTVTANTLIATPLDGGSPIELAALAPGAGWSMRRDGGAFVAAVEVARDTVQLAMWEPATGVVRWLTAAEPNVVQFGGVWSPDGQAFYFGSHTESGESVSRIRVDGSGLQEVLRTRWPPSTTPVAVSLGSTLYVEYTWEGRGGLTLNDLNSGAKRDFPLRSLEALRERQPGALVQGDFGGGLSLIDEPTGDVSNVLEGSIEIAGADWDPTGKRIVAAIRARRTREYPVLATMDESGGARHAISGTSGASRPTWVREGILYLWAEIEDWERWDSPYASDEFELFPVVQPPFELHLVNPDTGASRVILRSDTKFGFAVVGG